MLSTNFEMNEQLYNPINNLSQKELMEKFNLAFYEAQNLTKTDIQSTFQETYLEELQSCEVAEKTNDDYLIDYLISNDYTPSNTPNCTEDIQFDFNEFVENFDHNLKQEVPTNSLENFDTETYTTESSVDNVPCEYSDSFSKFFIPPPFNCERNQEQACALDTIELDCDNLSNESLGLGSLQNLEEEYDEFNNGLPSFSTLAGNTMDFNNFMRVVPDNDLAPPNEVNKFFRNNNRS